MPRNKSPSYVYASPWDCETKKFARFMTIIDIYKRIFNTQIPKDKQYWTMCGAHFDKEGLPLLGELGQILDKKLITPNQFYGVDREESIIEKNSKLFPDTNWIHGDFVETLESWLLGGKFNPAVINYDGVMQPKRGMRYFKQILKLLDYNYGDEVLLISNFILRNPYRTSDVLTFSIDDTIKELSELYFFPDHWSVFPKAYVYDGYSSKSNSQMGVIIFVKTKHDINNIQITPNRRIGKGDSL